MYTIFLAHRHVCSLISLSANCSHSPYRYRKIYEILVRFVRSLTLFRSKCSVCVSNKSSTRFSLDGSHMQTTDAHHPFPQQSRIRLIPHLALIVYGSHISASIDTVVAKSLTFLQILAFCHPVTFILREAASDLFYIAEHLIEINMHFFECLHTSL